MSEKPLYQQHTVEELAQDVSFIQWVRSSHPTHEVFSALQKAFPDRVNEASQWVNQLAFTPHSPSEDRLQAMHEAIASNLDTTPSKTRRIRPWAYAAAALLLLALGVAFWAYSPKTYHTQAGEQLAITLPDGSQVQLNGNSSLKTARFWRKQQTRRVALSGEAFFSVEKAGAAFSKPFEVIAGDTKVAVLGTRFNVRQFGASTTVVLNEGRVRIEDQRTAQTTTEELLPGQMASIDGTASLALSQVDTSLFTSWHRGYYTLDNTPLSNLIDILRENYGQSVVLTRPSDADRLLTGRLPANTLDELLQAIEVVLSVEVVQEDGNISFR